MPIDISDYSFSGPYTETSSLEGKPGVYLILDCFDNEYFIVDIGESAKVRNRVENHDRKDCWDKKIIGEIMYAVLYTPNIPQSGRVEIEQSIRSKLAVPCGEGKKRSIMGNING